MLVLTLWMLNVLFDTGGQLAFKRAAITQHSLSPADGDAVLWARRLREPWIWVGIFCFVTEFVLWLAFLSVVPLSRGVLLGSINIVAIVVAGRLLFGETLSGWRVAGIVLIAGGVAIVGWN